MADNLTPIKVKGNGVAGTADTNVLTIQGIAAMTPVLTTSNLTQWATTVLGTPTNFGTTPGAVVAGSVNASIFAGTTALTNTGGALDVNVKTSGLTNQSVNIAQVGGTATGVTNPLFVELSNGTSAISESNPLPVFMETTIGTAQDSGQLTSAALAAGANVTVSAADITTGKTGKLIQGSASSSVPLKIEFQTFNGTTATTVRTFFTEAMGSYVWNPVDDSVATQAGGTSKHFQIKLTNMDNNNAADVYGGLTWLEE